jgi:enolase
MKIRTGFVSNSSSSSYIISKKNLTEEQIYMIKNHVEYCYELLEKEKKNQKRIYSKEDPFGEEEWDEKEISIEKLRDALNLNWGDGSYRISKHDKWKVLKETDEMIHLGTIMDNFDLYWFLRYVAKVDDNDIKWEY